MKCDTCGDDLTASETLIVWNETDDGVVTEMRFVHRGKCDDSRLYSSAGAAYGADWDPQHERNGVARRPFVDPEQRTRLFDVLRSQAARLRVAGLN